MVAHMARKEEAVGGAWVGAGGAWVGAGGACVGAGAGTRRKGQMTQKRYVAVALLLVVPLLLLSAGVHTASAPFAIDF